MTAVLRNLGVLVTSRYHAPSCRSRPRSLATVGHDLRLRTLYSELGIEHRYFLTPDQPDVFDRMTDAVDELLSGPVEEVRERLRAGHDAHLAAARKNREFLRTFAGQHGWGCRHGRRSAAHRGTGFLGTEVAARLLERSDLEIVSLVLADTDAEAILASDRAWWFRPDLRAELGARIHAIAGDVAKPTAQSRLGHVRPDLCDRVTHIVHSAADLRVAATVEELRATNVDGVANIINFAGSAPRFERLVTCRPRTWPGVGRGTVSEDDLTDAFGFGSAYEQTKYEGRTSRP